MKKLLSLLVVVITIMSILLHSCRKDKDIVYSNKSPIANAGIDQLTVLPKDSVVLDGSASTDPDGSIAYYQWSKIAGPASCGIVEPNRATTVVRSLVLGVYRFELTIKDNSGTYAKDTVQVIVSASNGSNLPPVANAGADQVITLPANYCMLNGSGSFDPDGTITSYQWTQVEGSLPASFNTANAVSSWVHNMIVGIYRFELAVTDNKGGVGKDTVQVTVNAGNGANQAPIANAGADQTITYPLNYYMLNGSASSDPDGPITGYLWSQLAGPSVAIEYSTAINPSIYNLAEGVYVFQLVVTDNGGLTAKDTIQLTVRSSPDCNISNRPQFNVSVVPIGTLSVSRNAAIGAAGNKIVFAGGATYDNNSSVGYSGVVDIYNISMGTWTTAQLSYARADIAAISCGNKIFFAGGNRWGAVDEGFTNVDIYDAGTNTWTLQHLSKGRGSIATATVGSKVFFAGGTPDWWQGSSRVDIYDTATKGWSTAELNVARMNMSAVTVGNKVYFAGGEIFDIMYSTIDIYDNATGSWSTSTLKELGGALTGVVVGNHIYWAGTTRSAPMGLGRVERWNTATGAVDFDCLAHSKTILAARAHDIVFFDNYRDPGTDGRIDLYNTVSGTWSVGVLNKRVENPKGISVNNIVYLVGSETGGTDASKVYRLSWD
jgi:hypothetical protein